MGYYGNFEPSLVYLRDALQDVRSHWTDPTAQTYDCMHENLAAYAANVTNYYNDSVAALGEVNKYYNEDDFDAQLNTLGAMVEEA